MVFGVFAGVLLMGIAVIFFPSAALASSASFYFSESVSLEEEGMFSVDVMVATDDVAVNAAEGSIIFDAETLNVVDISIKRSAFHFWVTEPSVTHASTTLKTQTTASSTIDFLGGTIWGFHGFAPIMTITFKRLTASSSELFFSSGGIYAADGRGTNVTSGMDSARQAIDEMAPFVA